MTSERAPYVVLATALLLALAALAIAGRARGASCPALVAELHSDVAPTALPVVAVPGAEHEHWVMRAWGRDFDRDLGEFRLECETFGDQHYWDYDHCALAVPACTSEPLAFDHYAMSTNDLVLHRAAGGLYVLSDARETAYLSFRSEPTGRRAGLAPLVVALVALGAALVALVAARRGRERAALFSEWRDGVVGDHDVVIPADGAPRVRLATPGFAKGTPVMFAPPRESADYRSAEATVEAREGTREGVLRRRAVIEKRALLVGAVAISASVAVVVWVLARA